MPKITTFLTYNDQAEEAANLLCLRLPELADSQRHTIRRRRAGAWEKLSEGGEPGPCGWLKDRFGLSWQVNPTILGEMLSDPDSEKSKRVMEAMLKMKKIVIEDLEKAYNG